jgi:probable DNA metabolism protein
MMIRITIDPSFSSWRQAARGLLMRGVEPRDVEWREAENAQASLGLSIEADAPGASGSSAAFRVPRRFVEVGEAAACHADPERWGVLYRVLWRQTHGEPRLMEVASDADVHRLLRMEKAVGREIHKLHAFVRFRAVEHEGGTHYVAWFEPGHNVVERGTPFFVDRFPSMRWSILTPRRCAHWDGERLAFTPGVPRSQAPDEDRLEALWRTYYTSTFNPARLRPPAMRAEMPIRYWKNLPEARLIAPLTNEAPARVRQMLDAWAGADGE